MFAAKNNPEMPRQETIQHALSLFDEGYNCSQAVLLAFSGRFGLDEDHAKLISLAFGGGMGRLRQKCGAVTGGFMVLGLAYGSANPTDMDTRLAAYQKIRRLNQMFEDIFETSNCAELLQKDAPTDSAGGTLHKAICRKAVGDTTGLLYDMLHEKNTQNP